MSTDLYRPVANIRIRQHSPREQGVTRERAIRFYCTQHAAAWSLQVRAPMGVGTFGYTDGKNFAIAAASLGVEDLKALRAAIDEALAEAGQ